MDEDLPVLRFVRTRALSGHEDAEPEQPGGHRGDGRACSGQDSVQWPGLCRGIRKAMKNQERVNQPGGR